MGANYSVSKVSLLTMELLQYLARQFAYDAWANAEVLSAIKAASPESQPGPLKLLGHILSAERLWLERLRQQPQTMSVWPEFGLAQCQAQIAELADLWRGYFTKLSDAKLSKKISYKNSKGEPWINTVQDVLTHVVLHSAYHRGQIASLLRASGNSPAYTDFIHAVRRGLIE
ncbi:MAG: DinB family protein [Candidatus Sulfotelmatobacter sp.]|jgi:uncharacterized damage-inducible protein DinB